MSRSSLPLGCIGLILLTIHSPSAAQYVCGPQWFEALPPVDGTVYGATTWDPDGEGPSPPLLILGGTFSMVGGVAAGNVAAFDGANFSPLGSGLNGLAWAFTTYNGNLVAGGYFTSAGGVPANNVAVWDGSNWSPLAGGLNSSVTALAVYNGDLYAGGAFTVSGTQSIARWDGSAWLPVGGGVGVNGCPGSCGASVSALEVYNGELVAGGQFTLAGGVLARNIARWNGGQWHYLDGGVSHDVSCLTIYNGLLIAGGCFLTAGGTSVPANRIAAWNGSGWFALGSGFGGGPTIPDTSVKVYTLAANNGRLFAGGYFGQAGGSPANYIAQWDGANWAPLGSGMDVTVSALTAYGSDVVAGGSFVMAGGIPSVHWARWRDTPPPQITQQPVGQSLVVGQNVSFSVSASGLSPLPLQYQWRKNWSPLSEAPPFSGTQTAELTISSAGRTDAGLYDVIVTDCKSTTSSAASLYVTCPLAVSNPSWPMSVSVGDTVTASVTVSGAFGTSFFSWRRNGVALSDDFHISGSASPALTISPAGTGDSGTYAVLVTDDCGSVASAAASLAVTCPGTVAADLDGDCDVDPSDLETFLSCASGPAVPAVIGPGCPPSRTNQTHAVADLDIDGDVDQEDFGILQRCFSGANQPPATGCNG